jgi:hypothetical protein
MKFDLWQQLPPLRHSTGEWYPNIMYMGTIVAFDVCDAITAAHELPGFKSAHGLAKFPMVSKKED